jgi:hypothetical protein
MTFMRISVSPGGVMKNGRWCVASEWIALAINLLRMPFSVIVAQGQSALWSLAAQVQHDLTQVKLFR